MAKISARGAQEVARITAASPGGARYIYVMASDGRVLYRPTGDAGSGYSIHGRKAAPIDRTRKELIRRANADGREVIT